MQTISFSPTRGGAASSPRAPQRAAATTYRVAGSANRGTTGKLPAVSKDTAGRRYLTRELLGRGGMSDVYRGFDAQLGRPVAIKRLRSDLAMNPVCRARFRREAQAAGRLSHPAIVAVYDTGEDREVDGPSIPFIVMELVEGRSLREALCQDGRVSPVRALKLTAGVLEALACSHAAGIIHRDIKPANVMLTKADTVKVADFGIARAVSDSTGTATMAGTVVGTAQYLSPEQGRGEATDVRSDIYSVGCMLYELLVGEPPFTGDSMVGIVFRHISEPPTPPSDKNPEISSDIDAIVLKALSKDPDHRYQSAAEMKTDVESVLGGRTPAATAFLPGPMIESSTVDELPDGSNHPRHSGRLVASITALLLVLAGASAFGFYKPDRPQAAAVTTTEVPAVLGLGHVGVESVLRNADLVPRFRFVHAVEGASVATAIRQSPAAGELASVNGTVTVVINIGPRRETSRARLIARDGEFRPATGQPRLTDYDRSSLNIAGGSHPGQAPESGDISQQTGESDRSISDKINRNSGRGSKSQKGR